jgi:hypothetical protein
MLSKLARFSSTTPSPALPEPQPQELSPQLGVSLAELRRVTGGTLGVGFTAHLGGRAVFLKTHSTPEGEELLRREASLLAAAYGDLLAVQSIVCGCPARRWLICDQLQEPSERLRLSDIQGLVAAYGGPLARAGASLSSESFVDFAALISAGQAALDLLAHRSLLSSEHTRWLADILGGLGEVAPRLNRLICHGDLGPRNILQAGRQHVAIDWEDAFLGIRGYDELYWLSFLENAPLLRSGWPRLTDLSPELERGLLGLIVLLKCRIAVDTGAHRNHRLSPDQRLGEIVGLPLPA